MDVVNVVILEDGGNTSLIRSYFSSPAFHIIENYVDLPTLERQPSEKDLIFSAIYTSYIENAQRSCIVIKNTSISTHNPDSIQEVVSLGMQVPDFDLFYLCKWEDMCNAYSPALPDSRPGIYWSRRPRGFQSVLFSPEGISKILALKKLRRGAYFRCVGEETIAEALTSAVVSGDMRAICTTPNLFDFDAMEYAETNQEFYKLNECMIATPGNADSGANPHIYFYALGAIILVIIIGIGLSKMGPDTRTRDDKDLCGSTEVIETMNQSIHTSTQMPSVPTAK